MGTRCAHPPFAPVAPPRAPTSEKNAAGHVASRLVAPLEIPAADARADADRRAPTAPFTQAKFCDSLTDRSQSNLVPLSQSRELTQPSLSPHTSRKHATTNRNNVSPHVLLLGHRVSRRQHPGDRRTQDQHQTHRHLHRIRPRVRLHRLHHGRRRRRRRQAAHDRIPRTQRHPHRRQRQPPQGVPQGALPLRRFRFLDLEEEPPRAPVRLPGGLAQDPRLHHRRPEGLQRHPMLWHRRRHRLPVRHQARQVHRQGFDARETLSLRLGGGRR